MSWRSTIAVGAICLTLAGVTTACAKSSDQSSAAGSTQAAQSSVDAPPADATYLGKLGWTPMPGARPSLDCTDSSYAKAVKSGITLGIYNAPPYEYIDKSTNKPAGLDWDINMAVLKYIGVTKYTTVNLQWDGMIPALKSGRIDVITGNIHQNPDRLKNIAFTAPAWWYGAAMMVTDANPSKVETWADLTRSGIKVGVINGSQSQQYLQSVKANIVSYQDANSMFASLQGQREDVVLDDAPKEASYIKSNPNSGLKILTPKETPPGQLAANYARYGLRISDCSLNNAYSRALSELRAHGVISTLLKKYGLEQNMFEPQYRP